MNSSENIRNAFKVVYKTYENIDKMMKYCKVICEDNNYVQCTNKFLRWKSDSDFYGWAINNFILIFQNKSDMEYENGLRNGPLYVLEIDFSYECIPTVYISKYEYKNIDTWSGQFSAADNWRFYWPVRKREYFKQEKIGEYDIYLPEVNSEIAREKYYLGLERAVRYSEDLVDINSDNIAEKIFERFNLLRDI